MDHELIIRNLVLSFKGPSSYPNSNVFGWAIIFFRFYHALCYHLFRHQAPLPNQLLELAYQRIISLTQGFGSSNGYRYIWHIINREGIQIPQIRVQ